MLSKEPLPNVDHSVIPVGPETEPVTDVIVFAQAEKSAPAETPGESVIRISMESEIVAHAFDVLVFNIR